MFTCTSGQEEHTHALVTKALDEPEYVVQATLALRSVQDASDALDARDTNGAQVPHSAADNVKAGVTYGGPDETAHGTDYASGDATKGTSDGETDVGASDKFNDATDGDQGWTSNEDETESN